MNQMANVTREVLTIYTFSCYSCNATNGTCNSLMVRVWTMEYFFSCSWPLLSLATQCFKEDFIWATFENTIILFVCPPIFCLNIVSIFSWDLQWPQENTKTMLMQNFGGQTEYCGIFESGLLGLCRANRGCWQSQ